MKEYIVIKCGKWAVYKRDTIKKVEMEDDTVRVMWSNDNGNVIADSYYPNNTKQFFRKLMKDLGVDEENKRNKEI
jgi:hypothetical protein